MTPLRFSAAALLGAACAWTSLSPAHAEPTRSGNPLPPPLIGFGLYPGYFPGFYGNGYSMYGPPVRDYFPVAGVYGGSSQRYFDFYPGYGLTLPLNHWSAKGHNYYWPPKPLPTGLPSMFYPALKAYPSGHHPGPGPVYGPEFQLDPVPEQGPVPRQVEIEAASIPATAPVAAPVLVEIRLPAAAAVVQFDGKDTTGTGTTREFESPTLPGGKEFRYDIVARWQEDGKDVYRGKTVHVRAGQRVVVDFTQPGSLALQP